MTHKRIFSLSKLTLAIENVINQYCSKVVWVKAEIVKLNYYSQTGHCYPDLVEKRNGRIVAEMRGNIWAPQFEEINDKFKAVLHEELRDDMTVVLQAAVTYHPVYGLALNIIDIDPHYTLGALAKQRAETIEKLQKEDLFTANKSTFLSKIQKTIAVISVESSKGYQDFKNIMENNPWGYRYHHLLFPAVLQGEKAITTITAQLKKIKTRKNLFDAVVIVRGGGGEIGLSCYDDYRLAKAIAAFPIPVLTGIGHSTNETVSEMVSYKSFITPTKIAEFLLQEYHSFSLALQNHSEKIKLLTNRIFERDINRLSQISRSFGFLSNQLILAQLNTLQHLQNSLVSCTKSRLKDERSELKSITNTIDFLSPENILKRGYSITRFHGKAVKDSAELENGAVVEVEFFHGKASAKIESIKTKKEINEQ